MNIIIPHGFEPNYTLGFIKGLSVHKLDLSVITSEADHERLSACGLRCLNLRGGLDKNRPAMVKLINLFKYYAGLLLFLARHRHSVVHFTGIFRNELILFEGIVLNLSFKLLSARYIYTAHNILPHSRGKSRFFYWMYRFIYKVPDRIVVHTLSGKQKLMEQFHVPERKIVFISIGLNEEMRSTPLTGLDARKNLGFQAVGNLILFFGKIEAYKGLDLLIEAFGKLSLPDAKLVIAGWCPDRSYRQTIMSAIVASPKKQDIILREAVIPNDEVEVYFKACDLIVMPYRNIYQSGIIFLSFRFGIPVLATNVGSLYEYIEDDMGLITRSNDVAGILDGLERFFASQTRFNRKNIIRKAQKYQWPSLCKTLLPLYDLST